jgi:DNA-binding LytR/AlgR family response regulator
MEIPAINENGIPVLLNSKDILFITSKNDKILLETHDHTYRPIRTLKEFELLLSDDRFLSLSKSNIVNMNLVKVYNENTRKAFFDKNSNGKNVEVSRRKMKKMEGL